MKVSLNWKGAMEFAASSGEHSVTMDAATPLGHDKGMTPKELVAVGLGGCTAMDVAALLKKHKQTVESFDMTVDIEKSSGGHPIVFSSATLTYLLKGNIDKEILIQSVTLSQTKYCGVSAMLSKALPITYKIVLNGEPIHEGRSHFGE
ncbi:MAG: OsmC family protein [Bdellovibrionaceae bacterium]|nr:OsmC family protein [Pseudobdellovibrionaceae bacterium]